MPNEVISLIFEHLEAGSQQEKHVKFGGKRVSPHTKGRKALLALCLVSKGTCALAQPVLYQHVFRSITSSKEEASVYTRKLVAAHPNYLVFPQKIHREIIMQDEDWPVPLKGHLQFLYCLLRTFHQRPDLAGLVRTLDICRNKTKHDVVPVWLTRANLTQEEADLVAVVAFRANFRFNRTDIYHHFLEETLIQLVLVQLPRLKKLDLQVNLEWAFRLSYPWPHLPRLEKPYLTLSPAVTDMSLDRVNRGDYFCPHKATHNFRCTRSHSICTPETNMIKLAPNLIRLSCTGSALLRPDLHLPRLQRLELTLLGTFEGDLGKVLSAMPGLKALSYRAMNQHVQAGKWLYRALRNHRDVLEELDVSFARHAEYGGCRDRSTWVRTGGFEYPNRPRFHFTSLRKFTKLKHLIIDKGLVWQRRDGTESEYVAEMDKAKLVTFLPESLETLYLHQKMAHLARPWTDLSNSSEWEKSLVTAVSQGRFPHLKRAMWISERGQVTALDLKDRSNVSVLRSGRLEMKDSWESDDCIPDWADDKLWTTEGMLNAQSVLELRRAWLEMKEEGIIA